MVQFICLKDKNGNQTRFYFVSEKYTTASSTCPVPALGSFVKQQCWKFTYGNVDDHEIYSPLYPAFYPNNTECIHLLIGKYHLSMLNYFHKVYYSCGLSTVTIE